MTDKQRSLRKRLINIFQSIWPVDENQTDDATNASEGCSQNGSETSQDETEGNAGQHNPDQCRIMPELRHFRYDNMQQPACER